MISTAYASGAAAPAGAGPANIIMIVAMFAIFYFLLIRPQQKKAKQHKEMIDSLKKGMRVITSGGIFGTIVSLDDNSVGLEIAEKVKIKVIRGNIAALHSKDENANKDK